MSPVPFSATTKINGKSDLATLQKMYAFPIKLNLWKDVGNTIFPHDFINFPMFWKYDVSFTFQSLERPDFNAFPNWK